MLEFFYHISDVTVFFIMVSITTLFSLFLIILNKVFIFYQFKYRDNTTTASVGALIGIIYGVLVGFISLYLINNNDHAASAVLNEGAVATDIYRDTKWLNNPLRSQFQAELKAYVKEVVDEEWPKMQDGKKIARDEGYRISKMSDALIHYPLHDSRDTMVITDLRRELKALYSARLERIEMAEASLSPEIWVVIILSTILIIVINYAYRVNFYLHLFSISVFAIMAASILFMLVTLERPFQGEFRVEPDALQSVLRLMAHEGV